jgi:hypothetical protein
MDFLPEQQEKKSCCLLDFLNSKRNSNPCRICIEPAEGEGWLSQLLAQEENKTKTRQNYIYQIKSIAPG